VLYELFILGELMDQPMHGYLLHHVIRTAIGPTREMSWGALYPLIRRLVAEGLIVADEQGDGTGGGRARKIYRITEVGRRRFQQLMRVPGAYDADYADLFTIKLTNFDQIDVDERRAILHHYQAYVGFLHTYLQTHRRYVAAEEAIPATERPYILRALDHRLHLVCADQDWIRGELAALAQQGHDDPADAG
jgi:DNA-binding PadR family transcriptional regulator